MERVIMTKEDRMYQLERHLESIMSLLGIEMNKSTEGTPHRIAKMYLDEVFANRNNYNIEEELNSKIKCFPIDYSNEQQEMVILKDIPFFSMCEHHFMPFSGKITVAYVPCGKIIGLSKIPRIVKYFSKKPQLQERLVKEIADYVYEQTEALAVFVLANNTVHTCVTARGIETYCDTDTLACRGEVTEYKPEFYNRLKRGV